MMHRSPEKSGLFLWRTPGVPTVQKEGEEFAGNPEEESV
jgi:hypothetical protein